MSETTFDNKLYTLIKSYDIDLTNINDEINDINDEISNIKNILYPVGMIFKTSSINSISSLPGKWSLIGLYGTYNYDDKNGDTTTFSHKMTFNGNLVSDCVRVKSFTYQNNVDGRQYGYSNLSWTTSLSSNNYTIDYIISSSASDALGDDSEGFDIWVEGVGESEWGISKSSSNQDYVEWFTYATGKGGNNGYISTFRLTINDVNLINAQCKLSMKYFEYQRIE